ncbi:MAG TPA: response regulator [Armatimonadaceae bacterium]|nr:response regulator [Armatimonadaceae bacterium]
MTENGKHPILVVDDEPEILYSLRGLLRREFEVHTAGSAEEAMEVLRQHPVHAVMSDQRMPEMTGVELLTEVQGRWPDAVRMVFTGYSDIKAVIDAINNGHIFRYITKPWDADELKSVLRQACEEYDRVVERRELLQDLRTYLERSAPLTEGELAGEGRTLLDRVGRALEQHAAGQPQQR